VSAFWALDARLAYQRHYPAINWTDSYSLFEGLEGWWDTNVFPGWKEFREVLQHLLAEADQLENYVQLMGKENLPPSQQLILFMADLIKQAFLIQNSFHDVDRFSSPRKTLLMAQIIVSFYNSGQTLLASKVPLFKITELQAVEKILRMRTEIPNEHLERMESLSAEINQEIGELASRYDELLESRIR
jgi:V/A-type H+-transporting ATPase subunit A